MSSIQNKTYPLTPDLHWHPYLQLCVLYQLLDSHNLYKQMSSSLCTCYPLTTTFLCTHYWKLIHCVPSKEVRENLGLDNITSVLQQNRLQGYGHVLQKEDNDWLKKRIKYEVESARPRGSPKKGRDCAKWLSGTLIEQGGCHGSQ